MSKASGAADEDLFDPTQPLPVSRALTPEVVRVNEERVRRGFWPKLRRVARRIPFAPDLVSIYYCARDPQTPTAAKALLMAALAYFVLPMDAIPDVLAGIGYTDDAAVIAAVLALLRGNLKPQHRAQAEELLERLGRDV